MGRRLRKAFLVLLLLILFATPSFARGGIVSQLMPLGDLMEVHFIDVGQGDAIFIRLPSGENILIDGGPSSAGITLNRYLQELGVQKVDHLIATHPHEDHIGGLVAVIGQFLVDKVYLPYVVHSSETYTTFLLLIQEREIEINQAKAGLHLACDQAVTALFVAPNNVEYKEINDYSAVLHLTYGNTRFLFTGDAEAVSEAEILENFPDIRADVLKVGHHGSSTSSTKSFLEALNPYIAVISVGLDNKYGLPSPEVIRRLKGQRVGIFHNDFDGTVVVKSDGSRIWVISQEGIKAPEPQYIGNLRTKVFHLPTCSGLPGEKNQTYFVTVEEALAAGYEPCQMCKP